MMLDATHDPALRSWVESANLPDCDFPIQNLPHAVFRRHGDTDYRGGVAIGDMIVDMAAAFALGVFKGDAAGPAGLAGAASLNCLMAAGPRAWAELRQALSTLLQTDAPAAQQLRLQCCLVPQAEAEYALPAQIGDYTDFFTSYHHMVNAGRLFRPDAPELPNFKWLPIGYHGRASSVAISGTVLRRPLGQTCAPDAPPRFGPTRRLDYEVELGAYIGQGNAHGQPIAIDMAEQNVFGLCLLNDWSARDVQGWEAVPLGPFMAKNFLTTVSPWIVTLAALAPFRCPLPRSAGDPGLLAYLQPAAGTLCSGVDIELEAWLNTSRSGPGRASAMRLSRSSARHAYWGLGQMVTHHTQNGCNLRTGDLLGSGTQSGPEEGEQGCLLELSRGGREPITLANGEIRAFLEDGDTVTLRGWCERSGYRRIGFGECSATVVSAH